MTPRPPDSTGKLDSAETNPLPHVSSARAWTTVPRSGALITLPKAAPVIREKVTAPRRLRADGTEEICADDIMLIVPKMPSADEIDADDILVEVTELGLAPGPFRAPAYSVHATQEILSDDVLEVQHVANQMKDGPSRPRSDRDERPSTVPPPWTIDTGDDLEFPTPPKYSGQYPAYATGPRLTTFSATQVFRRRSANLKIVVASLAAAVAVVTIAGLARFAPTSAADGPVGIAIHAPKKLDTHVRARTLAYGKAPKLQEADVVSIDALPSIPIPSFRHSRFLGRR